MKVQVSERAVEERVKRALRRNGYELRKARGERVKLDLGDYYIVDTSINGVVASHCDLECLANEEGVMKDWEVLA